MFGISGFELLIILVFVLIIFGPDKLPQLGRTIGRAMGTFKRAQEDMERVIRAEMYATESKPSPSPENEPAAAKPAESTTTAAGIWAATDEADEEDEE